MKAISLFSGAVDGLGIAAETAGMTVTHHVEWDAWCCSVLRRNHPNSKVYCGDIKDYQHDGSPIDVVLGSPPCQGFSVAGKRRGFADERYLWPEMFAVILSLRPRYVVFENVAGAVSAGLIDQVCSDLESADYECWPMVYPACVFGAPHERNRLFIVAYTVSQRHPRPEAVEQPAPDPQRNVSAHQQSRRTVADANFTGRQIVGNVDIQRIQTGHFAALNGKARWTKRRPNPQWGNRQYECRMVRAADGSAAGVHRLDPARDFPGWPAGQGTFQYPYEPPRTVSKKTLHHARRIEALGNAVVWQQAYPLMRVIMQHAEKAAL